MERLGAVFGLDLDVDELGVLETTMMESVRVAFNQCRERRGIPGNPV